MQMHFKSYSTLLLAALLFVACQNTSSTKKEVPKKEYKEKTQQANVNPADTVTLIKGSDSILISKKKVVDDYDKQWSVIHYEFFNENKSLGNWQRAINQFIRKSLYQPEEAKAYSEPLSKELIRKVLQAFKVEARRFEDDMSMTWNIYESYDIVDVYKKFATLKIESSLYTGGAHGMYGVGYYHFDKTSGKQLHIKDMLDVKKELLRQAELVFRKKVGLKANTPFEENDFWFNEGFYLSDNFEITKKGITFYYNPYEISSWAAGMIDFSLTTAQISPYLKVKID
jgi:hypothetical protein